MKTIMRTQLIPLLAGELAPRGLLDGGKTLLAGVSGGADSMALLHAMALMRNTHDVSLAAVHVEHGLRGESSLADAAFVKEACAALSVGLFAYSVDVREAMERLRCGEEEAARILRHHCFRQAMAAASAKALLLAHHGDDQAETVLMHLMRGGGPAGLAGMAPCAPFGDGVMLRPFLSLDHATLCRALEEQGLPWREDATNAAPITLRNALRLEVMPILKALSPGCTKAMGRAAALAGEEEAWWREEAASWLYEKARLEKDLCFLDRCALSARHPAYQRRILRAFWQQAAGIMEIAPDRGMTALSYEKTEEWRACLNGQGGKAVNLPGNVRGERSEKHLFLIPASGQAPPAPVPLQLLGETSFMNYGITAGPWDPQDGMGDGIFRQALDTGRLAGATVRARQPGDTFRLLGGGTTSLKELLIARRVDRPFRDKLPLIAKGREILWVPGVGPAETAAIRPDTKQGTWLTLTGMLPWQRAKDHFMKQKEI